MINLEGIAEKLSELEERIRKLEEKQPGGKFVKPTLEQVEAYMKEKGLVGTPNFILSEAHKYMNHYTANDWKVGKNKMKDWKAAVRNWIINIKEGTYNGKNITGNFGRKPFGKNDGTRDFGEV